MIIGTTKELKNHEYRVGLTPDNVLAYTAKGHTVYVETGAGAGAGFSDEEYMEAISNAFQEWRYAFEKAVISCPLDFLMAFLNVLRDECCEILYDKTWEEYKGN